MREYNLFIIKEEYKLYKKDLIFDIIKSIKSMDNCYGLFLFEQLCNKIDIDLINNYLNEKFNLNKKYMFFLNDVTIELHYSRIIVKSRFNFPQIIKFLKYYNKYIFVVDFINDDYFWLNEFAQEKILI